jgi:hypothetical protein
MGALVPLLTQLVSAAPGWIKAGIDVYEMWQNVDAVIAENKVVGDPAWDELDASVAKHKAEFENAAKD